MKRRDLEARSWRRQETELPRASRRDSPAYTQRATWTRLEEPCCFKQPTAWVVICYSSHRKPIQQPSSILKKRHQPPKRKAHQQAGWGPWTTTVHMGGAQFQVRHTAAAHTCPELRTRPLALTMSSHRAPGVLENRAAWLSGVLSPGTCAPGRSTAPPGPDPRNQLPGEEGQLRAPSSPTFCDKRKECGHSRSPERPPAPTPSHPGLRPHTTVVTSLQSVSNSRGPLLTGALSSSPRSEGAELLRAEVRGSTGGPLPPKPCENQGGLKADGGLRPCPGLPPPHPPGSASLTSHPGLLMAHSCCFGSSAPQNSHFSFKILLTYHLLSDTQVCSRHLPHTY